MTDQSLFNQEQQQQTPAIEQQPSSSDNSFEDLLKSIKNERGEPKYDSLPKALEGLRHAQEYIPSLKQQLTAYEQELAQLKAQQTQTKNIEELIERLTAKQDQQSVPTDSGLDEQKVQDLVANMLRQRDSQQTAIANLNSVENGLKQLYGEKAKDVLVAKSQELGITLEELKGLSAQSPKLVLDLFKPQAPAGTKTTTSSVNTSSFLSKPQDSALERPSKSLLAGASTKDQIEYMRKIKEDVYKRLNVET